MEENIFNMETIVDEDYVRRLDPENRKLITFIEEIDMEEEPERLVLHNRKWVLASLYEKELSDYIDTLSSAEQQMCLNYASWESREITDKLRSFLEKYRGMTQGIITILEERGVVLEYTCDVETEDFGTVSSISGSMNGSYAYACECNSVGEPDYGEAAVRLASAFYIPSDENVEPDRFGEMSEVRNYKPKRNTMVDYQSLVEEATAPCGVTNRMRESHDTFSPRLKRQFLGDLVKATPKSLVRKDSLLKVARKGNDTVLQKAPVVRFDIRKAEFAAGVSAISELVTGFGSGKYGMGKMAECHYDGIMSLRGSNRAKHEYITDYIPEDVDIVFVDTCDDYLASAVFRQQRAYSDSRVVVVYSAQSAQSSKLKRVLKMVDGVAVSVIQSGVIGLPQLIWGDIAARLKSYFVSFRTIFSGKGTDIELGRASRRKRHRRVRSVVGRFTYYAYYAFVGSMHKFDKVALSCRGRMGDVIFTNCTRVKLYDMKDAMTAVYNMCTHAHLFPWLNSCYLYKHKDRQYFECRSLKQRYSFKLVGARDNAIVDFGNDGANSDGTTKVVDIAELMDESSVQEIPIQRMNVEESSCGELDEDIKELMKDLVDEDF